MDDQQRQFLRNIIHSVIHSALNATIWRLPTAVLLTLVVVLIGVVFWFRLF